MAPGSSIGVEYIGPSAPKTHLTSYVCHHDNGLGSWITPTMKLHCAVIFNVVIPSGSVQFCSLVLQSSPGQGE
ncbi:hypothetical protein TESG_08549 [Trichophyton tonsurans CBS 112818]|uniref:Uncharacterized protein n=1 Tax=Trichophyton tonsurans (strain CBS 112818) TaxID=647933 RepID=F2S4H4_TRIT1|nr:hypothetical protein TESG_08549 [Trichophyton tonsurans CBS 112818]